ncbi:hypothetical protein LMIY3S_00563 [Labrys miyagiensis]
MKFWYPNMSKERGHRPFPFARIAGSPGLAAYGTTSTILLVPGSTSTTSSFTTV